MMKTKKRVNRSHYGLNDDLAKIKAILSETVYDARGRAGEVLSDSLDSAKERTLAWRDNVENFAHERPFKSIGITLVLGMILGYLIRK